MRSSGWVSNFVITEGFTDEKENYIKQGSHVRLKELNKCHKISDLHFGHTVGQPRKASCLKLGQNSKKVRLEKHRSASSFDS